MRRAGIILSLRQPYLLVTVREKFTSCIVSDVFEESCSLLAFTNTLREAVEYNSIWKMVSRNVLVPEFGSASFRSCCTYAFFPFQNLKMQINQNMYTLTRQWSSLNPYITVYIFLSLCRRLVFENICVNKHVFYLSGKSVWFMSVMITQTWAATNATSGCLATNALN